MQTAQLRDAVLTKKFHFRKDVFPQNGISSSDSSSSGGDFSNRPKGKKLRNCFTPPPPPSPEEGFPHGKVDTEYTLMTLNEIINGKV